MTTETSGSQVSKRWKALRWVRRLFQALFLALFMLLIFATVSITGAGFDANTVGQIPYPVEAFLDIDPLIGLIVALGSGAVSGSLVFGLVVLGTAFFLGRAFCGWVCPQTIFMMPSVNK